MLAAELSGWQIAIGLLAALGSGALGSLIAPWAQHAVAQRAARQTRRAMLVDSWRAMIGTAQAADTAAYAHSTMTGDPAYLTLRKHLTPSECQAIEGDGTVTVIIGHAPLLPPISAATAAADRIEDEWGLT